MCMRLDVGICFEEIRSQYNEHFWNLISLIFYNIIYHNNEYVLNVCLMLGHAVIVTRCDCNGSACKIMLAWHFLHAFFNAEKREPCTPITVHCALQTGGSQARDLGALS